MKYLNTYEGFSKPSGDDKIALDILKEAKKKLKDGTLMIDEIDNNYNFNIFGLDIIFFWSIGAHSDVTDYDLTVDGEKLQVSNSIFRKYRSLMRKYKKHTNKEKINIAISDKIKTYKELGEDIHKTSSNLGLI